MAIFSVGELDFIEGQPFKYGQLMYPPNVLQSIINKDGKFTYQKTILYGEGKWLLDGDDFKRYNVLNNNPFDKTKINIYLTEGHETDRTRKIKEDREREQEKERQKAEEKARIDAEKATIAAENKRIAEEKRQEETRKWKAAYDAKAPERARIAEEEKRVREAHEESLRQRIDAGEPATIGNVLKGDRVKYNGEEAEVVDEWYEIEYKNGIKKVVNRDGLFNMTAVERTLKQEATNQSRRNFGGTRKRRKNRKTRYGMETRS
jgi:hypothetical protein